VRSHDDAVEAADQAIVLRLASARPAAEALPWSELVHDGVVVVIALTGAHPAHTIRRGVPIGTHRDEQ
jgi:hypothetical protein